MKFLITRTSRKYVEQPPCEEARAEKYVVVDRRSVDDPRKFTAYRHNPDEAMQMWYGDGSNHRVENGMIVRDMQERIRWVIDIENLEQLMELQRKYGELILNTDDNNNDPAIEIYDDYRE